MSSDQRIESLRAVLTGLHHLAEKTHLDDGEVYEQLKRWQAQAVRIHLAPAPPANELPAWHRLSRQLEADHPELLPVDGIADRLEPIPGEDRQMHRAPPGRIWLYVEHAIGVVTALIADAAPSAAPKRKRTAKRRRTAGTRLLTVLQSQALELLAKHQGDKQKGATEMHISRATFDQHLKAAWRKLPGMAPKQKTVGRKRTRRLSQDHRGQETVTGDK